MTARTHTHWPYIFVAYACLFSLGLFDNSRGPIFPDIIEELNLSDTSASLFFVVPSLVALFGSHFSTYLLQSWGPITVLRVGTLVMTLGFAATALSPSYPLILLSCGVFGFGLGFINVGQNVMVIEGAKFANRRRLLSGLHSFYAIASLFAPLLISLMVKLQWGWRDAVLSFSGVGALVFLSTLFTSNEAQTDEQARQRAPLPKADRTMLYMALILSFYLVGELLVSTRLVLFARREFGASPQDAPLYLTIFFVCLLMGRLIFTFVDFKNWNNEIILRASLLCSVLTGLLGIFVSPWWLSFSGLAMAPFFGVYMTYVSDMFTDRAAKVVALCLVCGGLFVMLIHLLAGYLTDLVGLQWALTLGPAGQAIALMLLVFRPSFFPDVLQRDA